MRPSSLVRTLLSGAVFYVVMAACAASDRAGGFTADGGGSGGGGGLDAIVDGVLDPVGEASAAEPDVAEEPCDKAGTVSGASYIYAVHNYPGKTVADLSAVRVVGHAAPSNPGHRIGGAAFVDHVTLPLLRAGQAAVLCGSSGALSIDSATFILP